MSNKNNEVKDKGSNIVGVLIVLAVMVFFGVIYVLWWCGFNPFDFLMRARIPPSYRSIQIAIHIQIQTIA